MFCEIGEGHIENHWGEGTGTRNLRLPNTVIRSS